MRCSFSRAASLAGRSAAWTCATTPHGCAVRATGEGLRHGPEATIWRTIRRFMAGPEFRLGGFKGLPFSFRPWDGQLRQPMLVAGPRCSCPYRPSRSSCMKRSPLDPLGPTPPNPGASAWRGQPVLAAWVLMGTCSCRPSAGGRAETVFTLSNEQDDTVSVVDTRRPFEVVATIPVGRRGREA